MLVVALLKDSSNIAYLGAKVNTLQRHDVGLQRHVLPHQMHAHLARRDPLQQAGQPKQAFAEGQIGEVADEAQRDSLKPGGLRQPFDCQPSNSTEKPGVCDLRASPARLGYE